MSATKQRRTRSMWRNNKRELKARDLTAGQPPIDILCGVEQIVSGVLAHAGREDLNTFQMRRGHDVEPEQLMARMPDTQPPTLSLSVRAVAVRDFVYPNGRGGQAPGVAATRPSEVAPLPPSDPSPNENLALSRPMGFDQKPLPNVPDLAPVCGQGVATKADLGFDECRPGVCQ